MRAVLLLFICLSTTVFAGGGDKISTQEYIETWRMIAINNMREFGIPASIILAQGILESGSGNSRLAKDGNNHFGIKCHGWQGKTIYHDDDKKGECFRVYDSAAESFADHAAFLSGKSRYAFLFEYKSDDYKSWAKGLKKAGYATNPKYPNLLIDIIERYGLDKYDKDNGELPAVAEKSKPKKPEPKKEPDFEEREIVLGSNIQFTSNNVKYIQASAIDVPQDIANRYDMALWQITKYNNIDSYHKFEEGEIVYLQPKRRKNCDMKQFIVAEGMNLRDVSQAVGVKEKHLKRLNGDVNFDGPIEGKVLELCKRKK